MGLYGAYHWVTTPLASSDPVHKSLNYFRLETGRSYLVADLIGFDTLSLCDML